MKAYTDIEQSKKLAEILPIESANMFYDQYGVIRIGNPKERYSDYHQLPVWSLAALIDVLPRIDIEKEIWSADTFDYRVKAYIGDGYVGDWFDSPLDACVDMIIKLDEQKLL